METKVSWKLDRPMFLWGALVGVLCIALFPLPGLLKGVGMGWLTGLIMIAVLIALVVYLLFALRAYARARNNSGLFVKGSAGFAVAVIAMLRLTRYSLGSTPFFRSMEDMLESSGGIWIVLGLAVWGLAWFLARRPEAQSEQPPSEENR